MRPDHSHNIHLSPNHNSSSKPNLSGALNICHREINVPATENSLSVKVMKPTGTDIG